jgi:hypothetical protein
LLVSIVTTVIGRRLRSFFDLDRPLSPCLPPIAG